LTVELGLERPSKQATMAPDIVSQNFQFLTAYDRQFVRLAALAERYFRDDPNTSLIKLRQFGELLAQEIAARLGLFTSQDEPQADLLRRLKAERAVPPQAMDLFHQIRISGNQATHGHIGDHNQALTTLKVARHLLARNTMLGWQRRFPPMRSHRIVTIRRWCDTLDWCPVADQHQLAGPRSLPPAAPGCWSAFGHWPRASWQPPPRQWLARIPSL
jgi:uncharacterized protein DUF4145